MASLEQIKKVEEIIKSNPKRRGVVVSAPGKRFSDDIKITDMLYKCQTLASEGKDFSTEFDAIAKRFLDLESELGVKDLNMSGLLENIRERFKKGVSPDEAASRGEHLMAKLFAAYLGATFVETFDGIFFTEEGFLCTSTYEKLGEQLNGDGLFIVPGFYGQCPRGNIKTFSRGGSDVTGSIVARAMGAETYENWTDTPGLLMCDPRIVEDAKPMATVTYREIRELAYMGAQVFHDEAVFPVSEAGTPINIRNTNDPEAPGTMIVPSRDPDQAPVAGIAGQKNFTLIYVEKYLMNRERGVGRKILEVVENLDISYEHTPSGIDSISVIISQNELGDKIDTLVEEIKKAVNPDEIKVIDGLSIIATVGEGMEQRLGTAGALCTGLSKAGINIRILDQGPGEINILVGVNDSDFEKAIGVIYETFKDG